MNENNNKINNNDLLELLNILSEKVTHLEDAVLYSTAVNKAFDVHTKKIIQFLEQGDTKNAISTLKKIYIEKEKLTTKFRERLDERK